MSDMFEDSMEFRVGLREPQPDEEELTQAERLEIPKCALASPEERIEQLCKTTSAWFYHHSLAARINIELGDGDPLQLLLRDEFYRREWRLSTRAL